MQPGHSPTPSSTSKADDDGPRSSEKGVLYAPDPQYNWGASEQLTPPFEGGQSRSLFLGGYTNAAVQQEFERFVHTKQGPVVASYFGLCGAAAAISANMHLLTATDTVFQVVWSGVVVVSFVAMGTLLGFSCFCDFRQRQAESLRPHIDCANRSAMILSRMCVFWATVLGCLAVAWDLSICALVGAPEGTPDDRKCDSFLPDPAAAFLWVAFSTISNPRAASGAGFFILASKTIASALYHIASSRRLEAYLIDLALTCAYLLASVLFVFVRAAASRRHFEEAVAACIASRSELDRGAELRELTAALLPPALLARLGPQSGAAKSLRESLHDAAPDATALATGIADLGALKTRFFEPTRVVHVIARFFELFDAGTSHFRVDRAMVVGDVYVVVAGLIGGSHASVPRLQQFAHWQHAVDETGTFPLRSAAVTGALEGDVLGSAKTLRYHVSGAALRVALQALALAPEGRPVCCADTLRKCSKRVSQQLFTAAGGVRFAEMPANDERSGTPSSSTDDGDVANAGVLADAAISELDRLQAKPFRRTTSDDGAGDDEASFQNPFEQPTEAPAPVDDDAPTAEPDAPARASQRAAVDAGGDAEADRYSMFGCVFTSLAAEREVRETAARELSEGHEMAFLFGVVALSPLAFLVAHMLDRYIHGEEVFALGLLGPIAAVVANAALAVEAAASTRSPNAAKLYDSVSEDDDAAETSDFRSALCVQQRRVLVMLLACSACSFGILFTPHSGARNTPFFVVFVWLPAFARLTSVFPIAFAVLYTGLMVALPLLLANLAAGSGVPKLIMIFIVIVAASLAEASSLRRRHRAWAHAEAHRARAEAAYHRLRQIADSLLPSGVNPTSLASYHRHTQSLASIQDHIGGLGAAASGATEYMAHVFDNALVAAIDITDPSLGGGHNPLARHWDAVDFALVVATQQGSGRNKRVVQLRVLRAANGTVVIGAMLDSTAAPAAVSAHAAALLRCVQTVVREVAKASPSARVAAALATGELVGCVLGGAAARYGAFGRCSDAARALLVAAQLAADPPAVAAPGRRAHAVATLAFADAVDARPSTGGAFKTTVSRRPWAVEGVPFGRVALIDVVH